jgi:limonene-1,2-epoxide hydrolase
MNHARGALEMARNEADEIVTRNEQVVRRFIDAWAAKDVDACMACLSPEIVYINQPLEPVVGLSNVRKIIKSILDLTHKVEWKLVERIRPGHHCMHRAA